MRLAAANPQPFQLDVAATSSVPGSCPKSALILPSPLKAPDGFMPAIQDTLRNKLKGTAISALRRWRAVRIRMGEIDKVVG